MTGNQVWLISMIDLYMSIAGKLSEYNLDCLGKFIKAKFVSKLAF